GMDYALAALGIAVTVAVLQPLHAHLNQTTVALALLLVVLLAAIRWGSRPAMLASVLGMLCFNYFFLPPVGTFTITDPDNWIALAAFLSTALTVGQLSARARRRAHEAEAGRVEIERLYEELRGAFERASHAEALRQSERLKSALLDAVTHDLRTPLTSIKASVTTLLETEAGASQDALPIDAEGRREFLEVINEEADRLNRFIEGLVELARIEAGEMHLRRAWGNVDEIIAAALARAEPLTRGHRITVEIEENLPAVRVDARALAEVVYTLVDNAAKYSPNGTRILVAASRAPAEMVEFAVEDEGRGIPADLRERVFDKFFRATGEAAEAGMPSTGLGMGLAIARGIIEAHGGRIRVEDKAHGTGTRISFVVPVGDEDPDETVKSSESGVRSQESGV
ncbi:MAG: DUF4118 domain-containing protein, partial [Pyrinomonadaceae bacterium]|nr:DUF4118 domain-containing protein [Pyrinomonadaceae bacterium]